jgi:hypothetical protein
MKKHGLKINGKNVTPEEFHRGGKIGGGGIPMFAGTAYSTAKPLVSEGVGCMKSQVPEMREAILARGIVGAHVKDSGQIEFTSRKARREVLSMRGLIDSDGGYSDG